MSDLENDTLYLELEIFNHLNCHVLSDTFGHPTSISSGSMLPNIARVTLLLLDAMRRLRVHHPTVSHLPVSCSFLSPLSR
jgi:hypothetical protein